MSKLMDFLPFAVKNLFSKPATSNYPFEPRVYPERSRGHIEVDIDACVLCGSCQRRCPSEAITVDRKEHFWSIERMGCVQCGYCVDNCPKNCLKIVPGYTAPDTSKTVDKVVKPVEDKPNVAESTGTDIVNDTEKCVYCTLCAKKCPAGAITVDRAGKTWSFDSEECLQCGVCIDSCPKKSLSFGNSHTDEAPAKPQEKAVGETVQQPVIIPKPEEQSGPITNDFDKCVYCTMCAKTCPAGALTVDRKTKAWTFNPEYCVVCFQCLNVCPKKSLSYSDNYISGEIKITTTAPKAQTKNSENKAAQKVISAKPSVSEQSGPVVNDFGKCLYCTLCARNCPSGAIEADREKKIWTFDSEKCVGCGLCIQSCPRDSLSMK